MQLGTFGAVMRHAIELEDSASKFYGELAQKAPAGARAGIQELSDASRKNKQLLEKTRRMEMQEMILETITGIDTTNYNTSFDATDYKVGLENARGIERKASLFYSDASKKLIFLPNAAKTLEKIGMERENRIQRIKVL